MKLVGVLVCLAFAGCAAAPATPATSVTSSSAASMPGAAAEKADAKPVDAPKPEEKAAAAPEAEEEVLPKIEHTPVGELRTNTRAKLEAALKSIKHQTSASSVLSILTRSLGKPTWIEDDNKRVWVVLDTTQCVRLVQQSDGSVDFEAMRTTESRTVSRTARQNLCSGKIERDE